MSDELTTTCRRCSECANSDHHWFTICMNGEPDDYGFACKHCDAKGIECSGCQGEGIVVRDGGERDYETGCNLCRGDGVLFVRHIRFREDELPPDREAIAPGDYRYYRQPGAVDQ